MHDRGVARDVRTVKEFVRLYTWAGLRKFYLHPAVITQLGFQRDVLSGYLDGGLSSFDRLRYAEIVAKFERAIAIVSADEAKPLSEIAAGLAPYDLPATKMILFRISDGNPELLSHHYARASDEIESYLGWVSDADRPTFEETFVLIHRMWSEQLRSPRSVESAPVRIQHHFGFRGGSREN